VPLGRPILPDIDEAVSHELLNRATPGGVLLSDDGVNLPEQQSWRLLDRSAQALHDHRRLRRSAPGAVLAPLVL
jgi:hypothetical protein